MGHGLAEHEVDDAVLAEVRDAEDAEEDETVPYDEIDRTELEADPPGEVAEPPGEDDVDAFVEPAGMIKISRLAGVPVLYQGGASHPQATTFGIMPSFRPILEATVRQTIARAPAEFGALRDIVSLGMFTVKPGAHGVAVANDWDRLRFANLEISPRDHDHDPAKPLAKRQRYWAFAAICRSNSAHVLHGFYNRDHENHIHHDTWGKLRFDAGSEANVKLFQAICNEIFGESPRLRVDGQFGSRSQAALARAQQRLGIAAPVISDTAALQKFLRAAARLGFALSTRS